jgi:hypothetical protein
MHRKVEFNLVYTGFLFATMVRGYVSPANCDQFYGITTHRGPNA